MLVPLVSAMEMLPVVMLKVFGAGAAVQFWYAGLVRAV